MRRSSGGHAGRPPGVGLRRRPVRLLRPPARATAHDVHRADRPRRSACGTPAAALPRPRRALGQAELPARVPAPDAGRQVLRHDRSRLHGRRLLAGPAVPAAQRLLQPELPRRVHVHERRRLRRRQSLQPRYLHRRHVCARVPVREPSRRHLHLLSRAGRRVPAPAHHLHHPGVLRRGLPLLPHLRLARVPDPPARRHAPRRSWARRAPSGASGAIRAARAARRSSARIAIRRSRAVRSLAAASRTV